MITAFLEPPSRYLLPLPALSTRTYSPGLLPAPIPRLDTTQSKIWNHEAPGNYERCILSIYLLQTNFFSWLSNIKYAAKIG